MNTSKYILAFLLLVGFAQAQTNVVVLEPFTVQASPMGELRFDGSSGKSALGDLADFANTPRSVSSIDATVMEQFNVSGISDISSFTSNVQSVGSFGDFVTVNVRGDLAETYVNGQRRSNNSFGFQPSFNGVESVDVVHGGASAIFGPGFYSGGYVNLFTKKAQQRSFTNFVTTLGTWTTNGNSFRDVTYQVDTNTSLTKETAIRVSYEGRNNQTFYHANGGRQDTQDLFVALNHTTGDLTWDVSFEYSHQNAPEQIGVNRVSQELIDHNLYQSGTIELPFDTSEIANGPLVKLSPTATLMTIGDYAKADVLLGQSILTVRISPTTTLQNFTLAEYVDRGRFAGYEYAEFARQTTFDNRTELHIETPKTYTIVGLNARYEDRKVMVNYLNTYFNAFDVSTGGPNAAASYTDFYYPGTVGMGGVQFFGPIDWTYDTTQSTTYTVAPFVQQRIHLGKFQFLYGARADQYNATALDPLQNSGRDSITTTSFSHTESVIYNITKDFSFYATFGRMSQINASVTGGGLVLDPDMTLNKNNFHSMNELYEVGARYQGTKSSVGLTGFWQSRQQHNFYTTQPDDIVVHGIEFEYKIQPTTNFFAVTNVTYMEGNTVNSFPYEFNGNNLPAVTEAGDYRLPGLSRIYVNQSFSYRFDNGFGVGLTGRWQSEQSGNALGGYHIPAQYNVDAHIGYTTKTWGVTLHVYNLTNQLNWVHNGDFYGDNVVIGRELPLRASLTITKKF